MDAACLPQEPAPLTVLPSRQDHGVRFVWFSRALGDFMLVCPKPATDESEGQHALQTVSDALRSSDRWQNPTVSNLPRPSVRSSAASSSSGTLHLRLQHREGPPRDTRQALSDELTGLRAGFCLHHHALTMLRTTNVAVLAVPVC